MSDDFMADLDAHRLEIEENAQIVGNAIEGVFVALKIERRFILPIVMIVTLRMINTILALTEEKDRDEMLANILDEAKKLYEKGPANTNDLLHRKPVGRA